MSSSPFDIDGATWVPVSRELIKVRTIVSLIWFGIAILAGAVAAFLFTPWLWFMPGIALVLLIWSLWLIRRQVPAIGYAELSDELAVRRGIMFKNLILIPYGRMQYIEVDAGPLMRKYGIATVTLHSAAVDSGDIPGVPLEEATRLRDRLTKRSESMLAGL